jgi:hypothetical protein
MAPFVASDLQHIHRDILTCPFSTCRSPPSAVPCYYLIRRIKFLSGALGRASSVQSGTFSGKLMTLHFPPKDDLTSHPPFDAIARAVEHKLFNVSIQIEMHYQCRYF